MRILLTGGSGDLGTALTPLLTQHGHQVSILDPISPTSDCHDYYPGSILDLESLINASVGIDVVIHIAAWHGIHEASQLKTQQEFWNLNVMGTKQVSEAWERGVFPSLIHISSSSVFKTTGYYGFTKRLAEQIVSNTAKTYGLQSITLRPRGFIPHWNKEVYTSFTEWAKYFWSGGVHVGDVARAVLRSIEVLPSIKPGSNPKLIIDRTPDFSMKALKRWDSEGTGSSFKNQFPEYYSLALKADLPIHIKPKYFDIDETRKLLKYEPEYSLRNMLEALEEHFSSETPNL